MKTAKDIKFESGRAIINSDVQNEIATNYGDNVSVTPSLRPSERIITSDCYIECVKNPRYDSSQDASFRNAPVMAVIVARHEDGTVRLLGKRQLTGAWSPAEFQNMFSSSIEDVAAALRAKDFIQCDSTQSDRTLNVKGEQKTYKGIAWS